MEVIQFFFSYLDLNIIVAVFPTCLVWLAGWAFGRSRFSPYTYLGTYALGDAQGRTTNLTHCRQRTLRCWLTTSGCCPARTCDLAVSFRILSSRHPSEVGSRRPMLCARMWTLQIEFPGYQGTPEPCPKPARYVSRHSGLETALRVVAQWYLVMLSVSS